MNGWIKLYRELITKAVWKKNTVEGRNVLIAILCMAYHEPSEWVWKGEKYKTVPGQFVTSLQNLAEAAGSGVSIQNVRTAIAFLEKVGFLTNEPTNHGRLITITNWASYQSTEKNQQAKQQTGNKRLTTKEEEKNNQTFLPTVEIYSPTPEPQSVENEEEFLAWFNEYPRRQAKGQARKAYWKARKSVSAEVLLEEISRYRANKPHYADWKMPATWLNGECWDDADYKPGNTTPPAASKPQSKYCALPGNQIVPTEQRTGGIIEW